MEQNQHTVDNDEEIEDDINIDLPNTQPQIIVSHWPKNQNDKDISNLWSSTPIKYHWLYDLSPVKQRSLEWLIIKQNHISASEVAGVLGLSSYPDNNPDVYFMRKCNLIPPIQLNACMMHGITYEPIAAQKLADMLNTPIIEFGFIEDRNYKFLGVSPDGFCTNGTVIEIKVPKYRKIKSFYNTNYLQMKHPDYYHQVQMQAYVTGADYIKFVQYGVPNPDIAEDEEIFCVSDIEVDKHWIDKHIDKLKVVWNRIELYRKEHPTWSEKTWQ